MGPTELLPFPLFFLNRHPAALLSGRLFSRCFFFSLSLSFSRAQESEEGLSSIKSNRDNKTKEEPIPREQQQQLLVYLCIILPYLLGHLLDVDASSGPSVEVRAHEGVDLGEQRGADHVWPREREHGSPHGAVERAVHGGDVVGPQDVEHGLRVARDEAGAVAGQRPAVQLRLHAHHRGAAQDVRPEQAPVPAHTMPNIWYHPSASALLFLLCCYLLLANDFTMTSYIILLVYISLLYIMERR